MSNAICPICQNYDFPYLGVECDFSESPTGNYVYNCTVCGVFHFTSEAFDKLRFLVIQNPSIFPHAQRALVSHIFKCKTRFEPDKVNLIEIDDLEPKILRVRGRPNINEQMNNAVVFLADVFEMTGEGLRLLPLDIHAIIGALDRIKAVEIFVELKNRGLLNFVPYYNSGRLELQMISLTAEGANYHRSISSNQFQNHVVNGYERKYA